MIEFHTIVKHHFEDGDVYTVDGWVLQNGDTLLVRLTNDEFRIASYSRGFIVVKLEGIFWPAAVETFVCQLGILGPLGDRERIEDDDED
jgi:hypothetical protein